MFKTLKKVNSVLFPQENLKLDVKIKNRNDKLKYINCENSKYNHVPLVSYFKLPIFKCFK